MSVGHTARILEEAGISTVTVYIRAFLYQALNMKPPRALITPHMLGRTMGSPGDVQRQAQAVKSALDLFVTAELPGTVQELKEPYRAAVVKRA